MADDRLDSNIVTLLNRIGTKYIMSTDPIEKFDLNMASNFLTSALIMSDRDSTKANRLYKLASRLYRERGETQDTLGEQ